MTTIQAAWGIGRSEKAVARRRVRQTLLARAARWAGKNVPTWSKIRATVLQVAGLGFIDLALWKWSLIAGLIGIGVSLLVFEEFGGKGDGR